ncbi:MAG: hypothetical protein D6785_01785 [Planctomycetota bacterium]|nr:MAG: hypothetical protein D6785_01785 [Planctomycetota bacterium]
MKKEIFLLLLFLLIPLSSSLYGEGRGNLIFRPYFWNPMVEGHGVIVKTNQPNSFFTLKELGLGTPDWVRNIDQAFDQAMGFDTILRGEKYNINISGFHTQDKGAVVLQEPLSLGDSNFALGTAVNTSFEIEMLDVSLEFPYWGSSNTMGFGFLIGVKIFRFDLQVNSTSQREEEGRDATLPYMGLTFTLPLFKFLTFYASIQGLSSELNKYAFSVDEYYYVEGKIGIQVHFGDFLTAGLEWDKMGIYFKKEDSQENSELTFKMGGDTQNFQFGFKFYIEFRF